MEVRKQYIVITGVSSGIGYTLLKIMAAEGFIVFGSVRKESDAERLATEFKGSFLPLLFDVLDESAVQRSAVQVLNRKKLLHVDMQNLS